MQDAAPPDSCYQLDSSDIHLWVVSLEALEPVIARFQSVLSHEERSRADRFRFDLLRRAFIVSRGSLRALLAQYLPVPVPDIRFSYGRNGKPRANAGQGVHFNCSRSGDIALYAIALDCELGVDVEIVHPMDNMEQIARSYFCPEEAADLMEVQALERDLAFYRCWTRKEAYIKAIGSGLSAPLNSFRVTLKPDDPVKFIHLGADAGAAKMWMLHDLAPVPGYAGALAYCGPPRSVRMPPAVRAGDLIRLLE